MNKSSKIALGILGAAAVGVVIGGLFYTEKGKKFRKTAGSKISDLTDQLGSLVKKGRAAAEDTAQDVVRKAKNYKAQAVENYES